MRFLRIFALIALCLAFAPTPALATTGYDSAWSGESAFVTIDPGQTQSFQVFFSNTGTLTWTKGSDTQVDLAACLEDKVTCNAQDPSESLWNSSWLSTTRYATTTQATVAPGSLGTFGYSIKAPSNATGTHRFNGDLVVASSGARIHPEGYYQEATVNAVGSIAVPTPTPTPGSTPFPSARPTAPPPPPPPTPTPNPLTCFSGGGGTCQIVGPNAAILNNTMGGSFSGVYFPTSRMTGKAVADVSGLSFDFTGIARGGAPRISVPIDTDADGATNFYAFISPEFCPTTQTGHVSESTCMVFTTANPAGWANWAAFAAGNATATVAATDGGDPTIPFIIADVSGADAVWTVSNVHLGE